MLLLKAFVQVRSLQLEHDREQEAHNHCLLVNLTADPFVNFRQQNAPDLLQIVQLGMRQV